MIYIYIECRYEKARNESNFEDMEKYNKQIEKINREIEESKVIECMLVQQYNIYVTIVALIVVGVLCNRLTQHFC